MTQAKPAEPEGKHIPLVYKNLDETPIQFANQFLLQEQKGEFILIFGQFAPPLIVPGTPEQLKEQFDRIQFASVEILARYGITETRLRELVQVVTGYLKTYDEKKARGEKDE